ncbi:MAG TPA: HisA/HisF-related TIM barrel protein [Pirellulales bacterium]|jgi:phosphoribosylformimino-5-aminoimidazole carboxamide ribotide isomerase|nr:HisA/HisF-related TIM barrel protein [Pirellulales bacterium]
MKECGETDDSQRTGSTSAPVIPVIDLMRGVVVRGVAGKREEYRPIKSLLCDEPLPGAVGGAFARLGFREAYVADLDAIAGAEPDWPTYEVLMGCGLKLLCDAGAGTGRRARELAEFTHDRQRLAAVIVGLESIADESDLAAAVEAATPGRTIFSLDLRAGVPTTRVPPWKDLTAQTIAERVIDLGVRRIIVLDLARVGVNTGVSTTELCRRLRKLYPALEIISGGGVRNADDLRALAEAGCDAALVASALHDGRLTAADLPVVD